MASTLCSGIGRVLPWCCAIRAPNGMASTDRPPIARHRQRRIGAVECQTACQAHAAFCVLALLPTPPGRIQVFFTNLSFFLEGETRPLGRSVGVIHLYYKSTRVPILYNFALVFFFSLLLRSVPTSSGMLRSQAQDSLSEASEPTLNPSAHQSNPSFFFLLIYRL